MNEDAGNETLFKNAHILAEQQREAAKRGGAYIVLGENRDGSYTAEQRKIIKLAFSINRKFWKEFNSKTNNHETKE
jgi:hypothetical protein